MTGYHTINLVNNTGPDYQEGQSFFTVFGVFFPTATGVFAGINMSGDLYNPTKNIPIGTMSAVGVRSVTLSHSTLPNWYPSPLPSLLTHPSSSIIPLTPHIPLPTNSQFLKLFFQHFEMINSLQFLQY